MEDVIKLNGYTFTPEQLCGRWKTLVSFYKRMKDSNSKSGQVTRIFLYADLAFLDKSVDVVVAKHHSLTNHNRETSGCYAIWEICASYRHLQATCSGPPICMMPFFVARPTEMSDANRKFRAREFGKKTQKLSRKRDKKLIN